MKIERKDGQSVREFPSATFTLLSLSTIFSMVKLTHCYPGLLMRVVGFPAHSLYIKGYGGQNALAAVAATPTGESPDQLGGNPPGSPTSWGKTRPIRGNLSIF
jgi:hypothetical protein